MKCAGTLSHILRVVIVIDYVYGVIFLVDCNFSVATSEERVNILGPFKFQIFVLERAHNSKQIKPVLWWI